MNKSVALRSCAVGMALALSLVGCSQGQPEQASQENAPAQTTQQDAGNATPSQQAVPQTWTEVKSVMDAAQGAGINGFGVPENVSVGGAPFSNPQYAYGEGVAQVTYNQDYASLIVRKADASHASSISDRNPSEFEHTWKQSVSDVDVTCYGAFEGLATLVTWTDSGSEYGITYREADGEEGGGMYEEDVESLVDSVMRANYTGA